MTYNTEIIEEAIEQYYERDINYAEPEYREEKLNLLDSMARKAEAFDLVDDSLRELFDKYKWMGFNENDEQADTFADEIESIRVASLNKVFGLEDGDS